MALKSANLTIEEKKNVWQQKLEFCMLSVQAVFISCSFSPRIGALKCREILETRDKKKLPTRKNFCAFCSTRGKIKLKRVQIVIANATLIVKNSGRQFNSFNLRSFFVLSSTPLHDPFHDLRLFYSHLLRSCGMRWSILQFEINHFHHLLKRAQIASSVLALPIKNRPNQR